MRRFSFRLQKLLNVKEQAEQQAKMRLRSLFDNLRGQETILDFLMESLSVNRKRVVGKRDEPVDAQKLMIYHNYIVALNERIAYQLELVNETGAEIESGRVELQTLQKERKILEKLRQDNKKAYSIDMRNAEIKQSDDVVSSRHLMREDECLVIR